MTCKGRCLKALKRNVNDTKGEKQTAEMCGVSKCKPHRSEMRHLPCESETFITSRVAQNSHSPWINESQKRRPSQLATVLTKTRKATRKTTIETVCDVGNSTLNNIPGRLMSLRPCQLLLWAGLRLCGHITHYVGLLDGIYLLGRGTARSSNQAPNNAIDTKQKAHKQE